MGRRVMGAVPEASRWRTSLRSVILLVCSALIAGVSFSAEAQVQERHYVFALDDSGSMGNEKYSSGRPGNDPYRMSRFAVRALLSALPDEGVSATVITMSNNGKDTVRGAAPVDVPPLHLLRDNRALLHALLNAPETGQRGAFTTHDLGSTPCGRILDGIAEQLNSAYRDGVVQSAIYLSDGACTDGAVKAKIEQFLDSLKSEQAARKHEAEKAEGPRPFQFYFICMGNEVCSTDFEKLAEETGGASYSAKSAAHNPQPEELVRIFGQTIGRSLDLCPSEHISNDRSEIQRYPGAFSTQLVAVPGRGESLEWRSGHVKDPVEGEHFWGDEAFRYYTASLPAGHPRMAPPFTPVNASRWRLLAIPYYRELRPVIRLLRGSCSLHGGDQQEDADVLQSEDGLPVGVTACAELVIVGEDDVVLRNGGLGREVTPSLHITDPQKTYTVTPDRAANTTQERFLFPIPAVTKGVWTIAGEVELSKRCLGPTTFAAKGGASTTRRARSVSYNAVGVDFGVDIEDASVELALEPGVHVLRTFSWKGNFEPRSVAQMWRADPAPRQEDTHACVSVEYGGRTLGHGVEHAVNIEATSGATDVLTIKAGADCGWDDDERERTLSIQVRLSSTGDASVTTLPYKISNKLKLDDEVHVTLAPGDETQTPWGPSSESGGIRRFALNVDRAATMPAWPAGLQLDVLTLAEAHEHQTLRRKKHRVTDLTFGVSDQHTEQPLVMRLRASSCCKSGEYRVPVRLTPISEDGHRGEQRTQILVIQMSEGSWLACWLPRILCALFLLFLLFLLVVFYRLMKHTVLIDDQGKNTLQAVGLTLGARGSTLERDSAAQSLLDGRRGPLGSRFPRKLRLMREGFGSAVRRRDWYETYRYKIGEGMISTPPQFVSDLGGLSRMHTGGDAAANRPLRPGLYLCAEGKGRPTLWIVSPESLSFVLTTADEESIVLRDLRRGRLRVEEEEDTSASMPIRIRQNVLINMDVRSKSPGDSVGFEIQG